MMFMDEVSRTLAKNADTVIVGCNPLATLRDLQPVYRCISHSHFARLCVQLRIHGLKSTSNQLYRLGAFHD